MITVKNIHKSYKEFFLNNINLDIYPGEFITLLGASGSGKSTLLKIILGMINDYEGEIYIDGELSKNKSPLDLGITMVFQNSLLLPHLNVEENIAFGLKMSKVPIDEQIKRVKEVLEHVHLEGFEKRHPYELSGGQQQRVAIARALVMQPKLLLMDEPFSALDQNLRLEMQKLLKEIQETYKSTVVFVTHDRDEAFYLSDKIALLQNGEVLQYGTPLELYNQPKCLNVARFLGIQNIFNGQFANNQFIHDDFILDIPHNKNILGEGKVAIKSTDIIITEKEKEHHCLYGTLKNLVLRHGVYELDVSIGNTNIHVMQNKLPPVTVGEDICLHYYAKDIILFSKENSLV